MIALDSKKIAPAKTRILAAEPATPIAVVVRSSQTARPPILQHALRAILGHGNIELESPIEPLLEIGDQATGTRVLASLYGRMKDSPYPVDLAELWDRLGVRVVTDGIEFDDTSPLAAVRTAMTRRI